MHSNVSYFVLYLLPPEKNFLAHKNCDWLSACQYNYNIHQTITAPQWDDRRKLSREGQTSFTFFCHLSPTDSLFFAFPFLTDGRKDRRTDLL